MGTIRHTKSQGDATDPQKKVEAKLIFFSRFFGWLSLAVAAIPATGWLFDIPILLQIKTQWPEMVPETILLSSLCSFMLIMKPRGERNGQLPACSKVYGATGLIVIIVSVATLFFYFSSWSNLGDYPLWLQPKPSSPRSCLAYLALAFVFLISCSSSIKVQNLALWILLLPFATAMLALIGYVSTFAWFYSSNVELRLGMSVPTAGAIVLLSLGLFVGPLRYCHNGVLCSPGSGGIVVRILIPVVVLLPPLLSILIMSFSMANNFSQPILVAMLTLIPSLLLSMVIYRVALRLQKVQEQVSRLESENKQVGMVLEEYSHIHHKTLPLTKLFAGQSQEQQNAALQSISHNLRTPLAAIQHWLALLDVEDNDGNFIRRVQSELGISVAMLDRTVAELLGESSLKRNRQTDEKPEPTAVRSGINEIRILVIDDEDSIREALKLILESQGALVDTAADTTQARQSIVSFEPQIIISDIGLPDEDGISFMQDVRANENTVSAVPAIAVTGYTAYKFRDAAYAAGFNAFFSKPVSSSEIIACCQALLEGESG